MKTGGWATVAAVVIVFSAVPAAAQSDETAPTPLEPVPRDEVTDQFPIDDGDYVGTVGLRGAFWFEDEGVTVIWQGGGSGPVEVAVRDGEMSGSWRLEGAAVIDGHGFSFEMSGINTWTMGGTAQGTSPYTLSGSGTSTSSVSAAGQTAESTSPIPAFETPLQGVLQVCGQVVGNWDQVIDASFEGAPLEHSLRSYLAMFSANTVTDLEERVDQLVARGTEIQKDLSRDPILVMGDLSELLVEAEQLLSDIRNHPDGCPPDPAFMRIITQIVQDVMNTFLEQWMDEQPDTLQMIALRRLVEVGLRAGALGAGATDDAAADLLAAKAQQVLERQFAEVADQDPVNEGDLTHVAITATLLGYTFESGFTGREICLVPGTCS